MFIISEKCRKMQTKTNNIRDIYDIVLDITNDEEEAKWAWEIAANMRWGDQCTRARYKMECVTEEI